MSDLLILLNAFTGIEKNEDNMKMIQNLKEYACEQRNVSSVHFIFKFLVEKLCSSGTARECCFTALCELLSSVDLISARSVFRLVDECSANEVSY
jgi:hypothetical protein